LALWCADDVIRLKSSSGAEKKVAGPGRFADNLIGRFDPFERVLYSVLFSLFFFFSGL
jgi:hypothetical protein